MTWAAIAACGLVGFVIGYLTIKRRNERMTMKDAMNEVKKVADQLERAIEVRSLNPEEPTIEVKVGNETVKLTRSEAAILSQKLSQKLFNLDCRPYVWVNTWPTTVTYTYPVATTYRWTFLG